MPMVAAAASYLDMFKIPLREIHAKFTKSEMVVMAWRAEEQYVEMHNKLSVSDKASSKPLTLQVELTDENGKTASITQELDETGELDLSKMTGKDALNYMMRTGLMPVMPL
jgi:hypothetical protein